MGPCKGGCRGQLATSWRRWRGGAEGGERDEAESGEGRDTKFGTFHTGDEATGERSWVGL